MANKGREYGQGQSQVRVRVQGFLKCLLLLVSIGWLLTAIGCAGAIMAAGRSSEMGGAGTYSELKESMTPPASGSGRLIVYLTGGGPNVLSWGGDVLANACTIDDTAYKINGAAYWYVDIPPGKHKVTADGVKGSFGGFGYGKHAVEFDLAEGQTKYCRIDVSGVGVFMSLTPVMVEQPVAEGELMKLSFYKNFQLNKKVK